MGWKEYGRTTLQCTVCGNVESEERVALIEDCLVCSSEDEYDSEEYHRVDDDFDGLDDEDC